MMTEPTRPDIDGLKRLLEAAPPVETWVTDLSAGLSLMRAMPGLLAYVATLEGLARRMVDDEGWWGYHDHDHDYQCVSCGHHGDRPDAIAHAPGCPIAQIQRLLGQRKDGGDGTDG